MRLVAPCAAPMASADSPRDLVAAGQIVAIDGPAGAGKTTVARALARRLALPLLDTGAIYRTLALVARRRGVAWNDEPRLVALCRGFPIAFGRLGADDPPERAQPVTFDGEDVTADIRTPEVSEGASQVSSVPGVRAALLPIQRALGAGGCVAEGRDMGTVVFPEAPYKFFLVADLRTRAARRQGDLVAAGDSRAKLDQVVRAISQRDERDSSRAAAPLARAEDAEVVDTSAMDVDAVIEHMLDRIRERGPGAGRG